ncbi:MAG: hypothetical protein KC766_22870 [Myxococcales bacterium]|nr:hypothetical protein [Myxococcales bacterium]MCB9627222.1 hypothetical protein [Sandaracinaceae bacterium]
MSLAATVSLPVHVVSSSRVGDPRSSQLYFASLLAQRRAVGGELCVALRRLHTIVGTTEFDHLRVSRFPRPAAVHRLDRWARLAPLARLRARGVRDLRESLANVERAPADWRELRAVWALLDGPDVIGVPERLTDRVLSLLAEHPETHGKCVFKASLASIPRPEGSVGPPPLAAAELTLVGFPSPRIALDTLRFPEFRALIAGAASAASPSGQWALLERVSLREMLTPA